MVKLWWINHYIKNLIPCPSNLASEVPNRRSFASMDRSCWCTYGDATVAGYRGNGWWWGTKYTIGWWWYRCLVMLSGDWVAWPKGQRSGQRCLDTMVEWWLQGMMSNNNAGYNDRISNGGSWWSPAIASGCNASVTRLKVAEKDWESSMINKWINR